VKPCILKIISQIPANINKPAIINAVAVEDLLRSKSRQASVCQVYGVAIKTQRE
jgi:hypothetical protein